MSGDGRQSRDDQLKVDLGGPDRPEGAPTAPAPVVDNAAHAARAAAARARGEVAEDVDLEPAKAYVGAGASGGPRARGDGDTPAGASAAGAAPIRIEGGALCGRGDAVIGPDRYFPPLPPPPPRRP